MILGRLPKLPDDAVVLLTGASTGLGLAIANELRRTKLRVILTARSSSMHRFAENGIAETDRLRLRTLDVTHSVERAKIVSEAEREWGGIDVLINNAGIAYRSVVEHAREEDRRDQLDVNFHAPMALIRLVLPKMRARRRGRIINISSVGGMMAMPVMSLYSASKWALEGASESLWYEVRPWGIGVTLVEPGFIRSASFENTRYTRASREAIDSAHDPYLPHYEHMSRLIAKLMHSAPASPQNVAQTVLRAIESRRPALRRLGTPDAYFFYLLRRFIPRSVYHALLYRSLPGIKHWGKTSDLHYLHVDSPEAGKQVIKNRDESGVDSGVAR